MGSSERDDYFDDPSRPVIFDDEGRERHASINTHNEQLLATEPQGELAVDIYQTPDAIVVKALVAGVQPNSIDISLTREMITISGIREDEREVKKTTISNENSTGEHSPAQFFCLKRWM